MRTQVSLFPRIRLMIFLLLPFCCFFYWTTLTDHFEVSRYTVLSAVLILGAIGLWPLFRAKENIRFGLFELAFLGYYLLSLASALWARVPSEALFGAQKIFLAMLVYGFFRSFLSYDAGKTLSATLQANIVLSGLVLLFLMAELAELGASQGLDNEALYDLKGVTGHKSLTAGLLLLLLPFNLMALTRYKYKILLLSLLALQLLCILLLQVRSVYLGLFLGLGLWMLYALFQRGRIPGVLLKRAVLVTALLLAVAAGIMAVRGNLREYTQRLNPFSGGKLLTGTGAERAFVWYKTGLMIGKRPLEGVGTGNWKIEFPGMGLTGSFMMQERNLVFTRVHNDFIEVMAETGIGGLLAYLLLFGAGFVKGIQALRREKGPESLQILLLLLGLAAYFIFAFLNFPKERMEFVVLLSLYFALLLWHAERQQAPQGGVVLPLKSSGIRFAAAGLIFALLSFSLYLGVARWKSEAHMAKAIVAHSKLQWKILAKEAAEAYHPLYQLSYAGIPVRWYEGVGLSQLNQPAAQLRCFQDAYAINPFSFHVINNYASTLVQQNRFEEAIPLYEQALSINPKFEDGLFNMSFCYLKLNKREQALYWLEKTRSNPAKKAAFLEAIEQL